MINGYHLQHKISAYRVSRYLPFAKTGESVLNFRSKSRAPCFVKEPRFPKDGLLSNYQGPQAAAHVVFQIDVHKNSIATHVGSWICYTNRHVCIYIYVYTVGVLLLSLLYLAQTYLASCAFCPIQRDVRPSDLCTYKLYCQRKDSMGWDGMVWDGMGWDGIG